MPSAFTPEVKLLTNGQPSVSRKNALESMTRAGELHKFYDNLSIKFSTQIFAYRVRPWACTDHLGYSLNSLKGLYGGLYRGLL